MTRKEVWWKIFDAYSTPQMKRSGGQSCIAVEGLCYAVQHVCIFRAIAETELYHKLKNDLRSVENCRDHWYPCLSDDSDDIRAMFAYWMYIMTDEEYEEYEDTFA